ncbi:MAG: hypothetical protein J0L80_01885 [Chitinophagales bacterium]|nr:hypothetical protein [Chitinophagales bacterium]
MQKENKCFSRYKILKFYPRITSETLLEEIAYRKINLETASHYLRQAFILDRETDKKTVGFAFANVSDGHVLEMLNPRNHMALSTITGVNTFSFVHGVENDRVEVFANHWDFLTWLTMNREAVPKFNCYILNCFSNLLPAINHLEQNSELKSVFEYLPNIPEGEWSRQFLYGRIEAKDMLFGSQNYIYRNYKGISSYWVHDKDACNIWPLQNSNVSGD